MDEIPNQMLNPATQARSEGAAAAPAVALEGVSIDPNYANRSGYHPSFLPGLTIPLPAMSSAVKKEAVRNPKARGDNKFALDYEHFSLVMNGPRRVAVFTAVNIDGTAPQNIGPREKDQWSLDPRIGNQFQIDGSAYVHNDLDQGHLVRRLDPVWGKDGKTAKRANDDTFHYTNCSPQHKTFNRGGELWQGLENYLLDKAAAQHKKLVVFTGPVLRRTDPAFRNETMKFDIQIPLEFWKIAVLIKPGGTKTAAGFIVSQASLIGDATHLRPLFIPRTFQVRISAIESLTGLNFGALRKLDTFGSGKVLEKLQSHQTPVRVLSSLKNIRI